MNSCLMPHNKVHNENGADCQENDEAGDQGQVRSNSARFWDGRFRGGGATAPAGWPANMAFNWPRSRNMVNSLRGRGWSPADGAAGTCSLTVGANTEAGVLGATIGGTTGTAAAGGVRGAKGSG